MEKKIGRILIGLLVLVCFIISASTTSAAPKIPKEKIPFDIPTEVRVQIERLYSDDPMERQDAASQLGNMGERAISAAPFLIAMLDDAGDGKLVIGVDTPDGVRFKWIVSTFSPTNPGKRDFPGESAKMALVKIGKVAIEPLIKALNDEDFTVRFSAASALGDIKDKSAVEPLIVLLKDKYPFVRFSAASALGKMKDARAIDSLTVLLKDEDPAVRQAAEKALEDITGKDHR
jgi:HEAT repeat protein